APLFLSPGMTDLAALSMMERCSFLSVPLAAAMRNWKSSRVVMDGTRTGAPTTAKGVLSLLPDRWKAGADGRPLSARPIQPSVSVSAALAACQMSIERKWDWFGFG